MRNIFVNILTILFISTSAIAGGMFVGDTWVDITALESDPVFMASPGGSINAQSISDWDTAYSWGDHGTEGYLKSINWDAFPNTQGYLTEVDWSQGTTTNMTGINWESFGGTGAETDPVWTADKVDYYTSVEIDGMNYLTAETDPVWTSDKADYYTAIEIDGMAYLTAETDPQVGTLVNDKWCKSNGTVVSCEENAPVGGDVTIGTTTATTLTGILRGNGSTVYADTTIYLQSEVDPVWSSEKGDYYTAIEIDGMNYLTAEVDGSILNEIQDLSLSVNTLSLSGDVTTVDLSGYLDNTDDQTCAEVSGCVPNAITGVVADSPLSGSGTSGSHLVFTNPGYITGNQTITLSGDATGSGTTSINVALGTTGVTAGTYQGIAVDAKGRVTSASNQSYLTTLTTSTPTNMTGFIKGNGSVLSADNSTYAPTANPVFSGTADFGGAVLEIPNGSAVTDPAAVGQIAIDSTSGQLLWHDGTSQRVGTYQFTECKTIESPADTDDNITLWMWKEASTITNVYCETQGGTSIAATLSDGTNALEAITCDDDGAADDGSIANGTFTSRERVEVDFGAPTGAVTWVTICVTRTIDAD